MNFRMFLMVFIGLFIFSAMAFAIPASSTPRKVDREEKPIIWLSNVDDGLKLAVTEYKPVLVFFSAKDCNWCKRLSDESLSEGRIKLLLQSYILVKVDAHENSADVNRYRISTVPMLMVMGADGSLRSRMGYGSTEEVEGFLRESLDLRFFTKVSSDLTVYQALLNGDLKEVKPDQWSALVSSLSKPEHRLKLLPLLLALDPFPATEIVSLLEHRLLSVRLGAIELLEELTGKAYDYDPWCFITDGNVKPLLKWKAWTKNTETEKKAVYSAITEEEFQKHIRDLISPNRERSLRARRLLTQGGIDISRMLSVFLESNKGLNQLSANQIQEVQYTMVFQNIADINAEELAHHLVFGNMDDKQRSLRELKKAGMTGFPIVRSYLSANDSLIRESAVDTIVAIGGLEAVNSLALALETETDDDVIHTIIKGLGNIQSRTGLGLLISFLENNNEDLVVTAIASIARLKSKQASDGLKACLKDKRWRVRVAALEAVNSLSLKSLADDVKELLEDEDDFVRSSAIGPYAKLAGKKAVTALESLFLKDDSLKAPVISAFVSLEVAIPESFSPSLEKLDTDNLLKCLGALKGCKVESLHIVKAFTGHVDEDVSSMAIRIIASAGLADKKYQDELLTVLNGSNDVLILAALEGMTSPEKRSSALSGFFEEIKEYFTASEKSDGTDSPAEELLNAFLRPEPVKSTSSDLFSSFMITDSNENRETEDNKKTAAQIAQKIQTWFQGTDNNKFRFLSALFHLISGQIDVVDYLIKELKNQPTQERMVVAGLLSRAKKNEILPLVKVLIDDSSSEVREKAVASAFSLSGELPAILPALFEMLLKDSSNLRPWELSKENIGRELKENIGNKALKEWIRRFLGSKEPVLQSFGIFLLIKGEVTGVKEVEKFQDAPEAYIRSSVFYYEGRFNKESFSGMFNDILKDPSAEVRLVIPIILAMTPQVEFKHSFDKDHFSMINRFDYSHYGRFSQSATLTASEQSVLEKLTKDESPKVRAEAFFALLSYKKKVDLTEFVSAIESSPEQNAVTKRVSSFLEENYRTLGQTFVILLPYLEMADSNYKQYDVIKEHFGVESSNVTTAVTRLSRESNNVPVIATFADLPDKEPEVDTTKSVSLLFFTKAGCNACEKISEILPELSSYFPNLEVKTLDIETIKAMEINEFLCDKYGVSQKVRLIAPAVFAANGCLIKEEIGFASLGQLLSRSAAIDDGEWFKMEEEDEEIAKESIIDRYSTFSVGVIALAGFLDGINPCAFATILFLLSYLQFTKRRPKEVSQIGIAFIAGVFIAYFTLGIGLVEVIARLSVLRWLGNVMNAGLAAFALIIMTLSVRDGILCLKGQMNDMTLQLPLFLKKRIHSTIRKGTKHRNFVLAAFVTGGIVSFLELACTGQVYAPTILFMLKTGRNYGGALWCLLIYNLAFIGPLIAVFILTSVGMTNQRLQDYFQGHGALVKFATAGLFFLIFLYLTVGNNLFAL